MKPEELLDRIAVDSDVCFGTPTVRGTRIWVGLVLDLLADGMTIDENLGRRWASQLRDGGHDVHTRRRRRALVCERC